MAEKRGVGPLLLGLGMIAGAAGALLLSDKSNRKKTVNWVAKMAKKAHEFAGDVDALNRQAQLDQTKKTPRKKK